MRLGTAIACVLWGGVAVACAQPTQLLVVVENSDVPVPRYTAIDIEARPAEGAVLEGGRASLGARELPLSFAVVPAGSSADAAISVSVVAIEGAGRHERTVATRFRPGRRLVVHVDLSESCDDRACGPDETCRAGLCVVIPDASDGDAGVAVGAPCVSDSACASGHCVDGVCCDTACSGGCEVCTVARGGSVDGTCTPLPRGAVGPTCPASTLCDGELGDCRLACADGSATLAPLPVDIILTVDNSGSMQEEIQAIEREINANFASVLDAAGLDYRVIVVSEHGSAMVAQSICISAPLSGAATCSPPPAEPAENPPRFYHYSDPIGSNDVWCTIAGSFAAPDSFGLHPTGWGALLRPEAFKHFIVVTDDTSRCVLSPIGDLDSGADADAAILSLSSLHFGTSGARRYAVHSIVGVLENTPATSGYAPSDPMIATQCSSAVNNGGVHQDLSRLTGGMRYPICPTGSYGAFLRDLASRLVRTECRYAVPDPPAGMAPDLSTFVVEWSHGSARDPLVRVGARGECAAGDYFVDADELVLCPTRCAAVRADSTSTVEVRYLCR